MSLAILIKQKKFIEAELKKGNKNYEKIYQKAKEKQLEKEKAQHRKKSYQDGVCDMIVDEDEGEW